MVTATASPGGWVGSGPNRPVSTARAETTEPTGQRPQDLRFLTPRRSEFARPSRARHWPLQNRLAVHSGNRPTVANRRVGRWSRCETVAWPPRMAERRPRSVGPPGDGKAAAMPPSDRWLGHGPLPHESIPGWAFPSCLAEPLGWPIAKNSQIPATDWLESIPAVAAGRTRVDGPLPGERPRRPLEC